MSAERTLFFSLWALVILVAALWHFRFRSDTNVSTPPPVVSLSPEITPWFAGASVPEHTATHYVVELRLSPSYLASLGKDVREVNLRFQLMRSESDMGSGEVSLKMRAEEPAPRLTLQNPERVETHEIRLSLAR